MCAVLWCAVPIVHRRRTFCKCFVRTLCGSLFICCWECWLRATEWVHQLGLYCARATHERGGTDSRWDCPVAVHYKLLWSLPTNGFSDPRQFGATSLAWLVAATGFCRFPGLRKMVGREFVRNVTICCEPVRPVRWSEMIGDGGLMRWHRRTWMLECSRRCRWGRGKISLGIVCLTLMIVLEGFCFNLRQRRSRLGAKCRVTA